MRKSSSSKPLATKAIALVAPAVVLVAGMLGSCGGGTQEPAGRIVKLNMDTTTGHEPTRLPVERSNAPGNAAVNTIPTMRFPASFKALFNDSNEVHLQAAVVNGFDHPVSDYRSAYRLNQPIVKVTTCDAYMVDTLTHSMPYLVPKSQKLLEEIGYAFSDTIRARCRGNYRIKVTSLTRSEFSSQKLQKRNRNASDNSCHRYGTTFDISWTKFDNRDPSYVLSEESLKNVLGEILYRMHEEGRCYIMYERKQSCFHITVR